MTNFKLLLVLLCLGLLGAMPFVIGASKPDTAGDQRESTVQGQTAYERQMAAQKPGASGSVRASIGIPLEHSWGLAWAGEYKQAMAIVDGLQTVPGKTAREEEMIGQLRQFILAREGAFADRQAR